LDINQAIAYLTHGDWHNSRLGLDRMRELLARLDNPQDELCYVHVAGTNGKGSICIMAASVLVAAGYKVGLYTSPYINRFNERIQINGSPISDEALVAFTERVKKEADEMADHPTEFELITAIAFLYYFEAGCDIVVLEVGMGGRLDATNIIGSPDVAVISPVNLDHTKELGDTVEKIAVEKAGIIKAGCHVVSSPQLPGVAKVLREISTARGASIEQIDSRDVVITSNTLDGIRFDYKDIEGLELQLLGDYQPQNTAVVISIMYVLRSYGWNINQDAIRSGLKSARWPARFEILQRKPWFIVDGGHNPQCVEKLVDNLLAYFPNKKVSFITGVMADKDFETMFAKIVPLAKRIFTVTPDNPRALSSEDLAAYFCARGVTDVIPCNSVEQGVSKALRLEEADGLICAFGSFYMAGSIRRMLGLG